MTLAMTKEMYGSCNIRCDTCTNTSDLMEAIRERDYDLLITDLRMPETNGYDVLKLLRSSNVGNSQTIPVIVTTAWGNCDEQSLLVLIHYLCVCQDHQQEERRGSQFG